MEPKNDNYLRRRSGEKARLNYLNLRNLSSEKIGAKIESRGTKKAKIHVKTSKLLVYQIKFVRKSYAAFFASILEMVLTLKKQGLYMG